MPSGTRKVLELVELTPGVTLTGRGSAQAQTLAFFSIAGNPGFWHPVHTQASNVTLILVSLHLGVYWQNMLSMLRRLFTGERSGAVVRARAGVVSSRTGA